jgi:hypothetical protein
LVPAELRWPPHPFRAGFCITDDTDTATLASVRAVYDTLSEHGVFATKTVWAFPAEEPCGIPALPPSIQRGATLADADYRAYCAELARRGFELSLHGASAGNNRTANVARGFRLLDEIAPPSPVYICHAKNADNPYWQEKVVARGPLRTLLELYARGHQCSGEDPASPYFWGELCRARVRYIRLLRTRSLDTLAADPAMPYFEREKPFVNGWFTASKRSFRDATAAGALDALEAAWGLTVLYQYMCRYADAATGRALPDFTAGAARLGARAHIWKATTGAIMDRLRLMHGVFLAARGRELWLVNTTDEDARDLQVETAAALAEGPAGGVRAAGGVLHVPLLRAGGMLRVLCQAPMRARGRRALALSAAGTGVADFGHGELAVNVGGAPWTSAAGGSVGPGAWRIRWASGMEQIRPRSRASDALLTRLFLEQTGIIVREVLFRGRALDSNRWLGTEEIRLENHDAW